MGLDREGKPVKLKPRLNTGLSCPKCGQEMHVEGEGEAEEMKCSRCRSSVPLLTVEEALSATEFDQTQSIGACEECGNPMAVKRGRKGFFLGCSRYPDCKSTTPLPKDALPAPQPTHERCDKCGRPLAVRWGPYGRFLGCSGFPRCRNTWQMGSLRKKCPAEDCSGRLIKKTDSEGKTFLGCTRFPTCTHTEPIPEKG
jgi:DNA topoisomerase-1